MVDGNKEAFGQSLIPSTLGYFFARGERAEGKV